jgi:hypothetical protein
VIPIAAFVSIDAGTASSSPFQRATEIVHDHAGIPVHVPLESAFTMRWKPRSLCAGICSRGSHRDTPKRWPDPAAVGAPHNDRWLSETRPIIEAFFHARYFLEMAVHYGQALDKPPNAMPSGWAALLYLYNLR